MCWFVITFCLFIEDYIRFSVAFILCCIYLELHYLCFNHLVDYSHCMLHSLNVNSFSVTAISVP